MDDKLVVVIVLRSGQTVHFLVHKEQAHQMVNDIMDLSYVELPEDGKRKLFKVHENGDINCPIVSVDLGEVVAVQLRENNRPEGEEWRG